MDNKNALAQELNEMAPRLGALDKKNPFKTPDYYFQSLPGKALERAKRPSAWTEKWEQALNRFFIQIFQPRYAIPFAICLVTLAVGIGLLKKNSRQSLEFSRQLSQISPEEISNYLLDNAEELDWVMLSAEVAEEFRVTRRVPSEELDTFFNNNIDNQTLEEELL